MWELWELLHWWWELSPNMEMLMWGRRGSIEGNNDSLRTKFTSHSGKSHGLIWACEFFNASAGNCSLPQRLRLVIRFCPVTNYSIPGIGNSASSDLRVAHTICIRSSVPPEYDFREMGIHSFWIWRYVFVLNPNDLAVLHQTVFFSMWLSTENLWKLKSIFRGTYFSGYIVLAMTLCRICRRWMMWLAK